MISPVLIAVVVAGAMVVTAVRVFLSRDPARYKAIVGTALLLVAAFSIAVVL